MVSQTCNNLIYSLNPSVQKKVFAETVENDVVGSCNKVKSAVTTLVEVGTKVFDLISDTTKEAKKLEASNLAGKEMKFVPTCVENVFGKIYTDTICPPKQIDEESEMNNLVQEVGQKIIAQSGRKDLDYKILVKKDDEEINAFVIPGGKIVVTSGLLNQIQKNSNSSDEIKNKLAAVLGYLVARSARSDQVKQTQIDGLFATISKVVSYVFKVFFPSNPVAGNQKVKLTPAEKKQKTVEKVVEQSLDLGGKIFLKHHVNSTEKETKELALNYTQAAGFDINEEDLDDALDLVFTGDDDEKFDAELQEGFAKLLPQVTKLFV